MTEDDLPRSLAARATAELALIRIAARLESAPQRGFSS